MNKKKTVGRPSLYDEEAKKMIIMIPESLTKDQVDTLREDYLYPIVKDYIKFLNELKGKKDDILDKKVEASLERVLSERKTDVLSEELDKLKKRDDSHEDDSIQILSKSIPLMIKKETNPIKKDVSEIKEKMKEPEEIIPEEISEEDLLRKAEEIKGRDLEKYKFLDDIWEDKSLTKEESERLTKKYWDDLELRRDD